MAIRKVKGWGGGGGGGREECTGVCMRTGQEKGKLKRLQAIGTRHQSLEKKHCQSGPSKWKHAVHPLLEN